MGYYKPSDIAVEFSQAGLKKTKLPFNKFMMLAILGGVFIAFGGLLSIMVSGGMTGIGENNPGLIKFVAGALFPVGLIMVSVAGADLFTSDCAMLAFPWMQKQINIGMLVKVLVFSYIFNFLGTQVVAYFMTYQTNLLGSDVYQAYLFRYCDAKVNQDFWTVLIKGIGANWLVCLGTWMGFAAKDIMGKSIGIWIPVMLFVTLGFEHSIANMYFIPTAIYYGADITWGTFLLDNLLPATIGNIIGGLGLVGCVYWFVYMKDRS